MNDESIRESQFVMRNCYMIMIVGGQLQRFNHLLLINDWSRQYCLPFWNDKKGGIKRRKDTAISVETTRRSCLGSIPTRHKIKCFCLTQVNLGLMNNPDMTFTEPYMIDTF